MLGEKRRPGPLCAPSRTLSGARWYPRSGHANVAERPLCATSGRLSLRRVPGTYSVSGPVADIRPAWEDVPRGCTMDAFNFVFSLFGLLLGLSLAAVLGDMVHVLKLRRAVHIGWLTPLLGLFVMLDLTSFWSFAWDFRAAIPATYGTLVIALTIAGLYYAAASLVVPDNPEEWPDFDAYYLVHRRQILSAVWFCNASVFVAAAVLSDQLRNPITLGAQAAYWVLIAIMLVSAKKRINIAALSLLIMIYVTDAVV